MDDCRWLQCPVSSLLWPSVPTSRAHLASNGLSLEGYVVRGVEAKNVCQKQDPSANKMTETYEISNHWFNDVCFEALVESKAWKSDALHIHSPFIKFNVLPFQPRSSAKHLEAHTPSPHLQIFPSSTTGISRNHLDVHSFDLNVQHPTVHVPWHNVRSNLNPWLHRDHPNHLPPWRNSSDVFGFKE